MRRVLSVGKLLLASSFVLAATPAAAFQYVGPNCPFHTIQAAIDAAAPAFDLVYVAPGTYNELLTINNKNLGIQGGATSGCNDGLVGITIVSGASHVGDSVVTASGAVSLSLHDLTISDGNENSDGGHGGGIDFGGHGTLTLAGVTLSNNFADYGGGLDVTPDGPTTVNILSNTIISGNTAGIDGGGIHIDGHTTLYVLSPQTLIYQNHAARNGGGIDITGPARADIGSPGYAFFGPVVGVIFDNFATNGGGISALAHDHDNEPAVVRLFTTDPDHPVTLQANSATNVGGAVYLKPFRDVSQDTANSALCAYNFRIIGNVAAEGAAIFADHDPGQLSFDMGSTVYLNIDGSADDFACNPQPASQLGGVDRCTDGVPCNEIAGNWAVSTVNGRIVPTDGAIVLLPAGSHLVADRVRIQGNIGGYVIRTLDGDGPADFAMDNCLISGNNVVHELLRADGTGEGDVKNCTLADDTIGATRVIHAQNAFGLSDSIVAEARPTLEAPASFLKDVLSNDISTLSPCVACVQGDPRFVNPAAGDYHLQQTSPAIDFASSRSDGLTRDLDGKAREVEIPGINSASNPRDLGAYELQSADVIFNNGFELLP